jgi:hypothetical protein
MAQMAYPGYSPADPRWQADLPLPPIGSTHRVVRVSVNLGFLMAGLPETERAVRCRELRALALVYLGLRHPATVALAKAIGDPAVGPRALALLDTVPALPRRRLLSTYAALIAPSGR